MTRPSLCALLDPECCRRRSPALMLTMARFDLEEAISKTSWVGANVLVDELRIGPGTDGIRVVTPGVGAQGLYEVRLVFPEGRLKAPSSWKGQSGGLRILRHALAALNAIALPGMGEDLPDPRAVGAEPPAAGAAWSAMQRSATISSRIMRPTPWSRGSITGSDGIAEPWTIPIGNRTEIAHIARMNPVVVVRPTESGIGVVPIQHVFHADGNPMDRLRDLAAWQAERGGKAR